MNFFFDISKVGSMFFLSKSILFLLMSKPITSRFFPNSAARGNPTYPKPIIAIFLIIIFIINF